MQENNFDPSMNFLYRRGRWLDPIFQPKSVAVIGASENLGSVGRTLMQNLLATSFGGKIFAVNPKREQVLGVKAYPDLNSIPEAIELAVIATPAKTVPAIIEQCVACAIPAAIIISAGFKEMGPSGAQLEAQILAHARKGKMRIIGPNCLGVMNPNSGLNATFAAGMAHKGNIAFISQSGALCTAVLDWSLKEKVGFSAFVSIGSMVDVNWGDLIDYFGNDSLTQSILIYMESIGDSRAFLSAAREVALTKPIILIKAGRSPESAKAAASHTGSLAGSDEVLSAALRRVGVLRVDSIAELFGMAEVLGKQPQPRGPRLAIVTNAGGPGVIATDALIAQGGKLAELSPETMANYNEILPAPWSRNNPIDILGDASAEVYGKAVGIALAEPSADGVLVILTPQDMTDPAASAEQITRYAHQSKPILASWMGANSVEKGKELLLSAKIPVFEYPDMACQSFASMWRYSYNLRGIYEMPSIASATELPAKEKETVDSILLAARNEKRFILDEYESKRILEAYGIPVVLTRVATDRNEAVRLAKEIGFPVVLKLYSKTITHKTDVGGVKLSLQDEESVSAAFDAIHASVKKIAGESHFQGVTVQPMIRLDGYELILGSTIDEQFGPVLLFGSGGQLVEVYKDRSLALPPLTTTLAKRMMEQTKIYHALHGVRGRKAVDLKMLEKILVQFSRLVVEQPWIKECDINPLLASPERLIALDARIILHDCEQKALPKSSIRPYPTQYVEMWSLKDKTPVVLRPIRPEDEEELIEFHKDLSNETVRQRYLKAVHYEERVAHERLLRICFNDYEREIAIVAEKEHPRREILGIIRLTKIPGSSDATFAMTIKDAWQNKGLGSKLMRKIIEIARNESISHIYAQMLDENIYMRALLSKLGFSFSEKENIFLADLNLVD